MKNTLNLSMAQIEDIMDEVQGVLQAVTKSEKEKAMKLSKAAPEDEASAAAPASGAPEPDADDAAPPGADASPPPGDAQPPAGDPAADSGPVDPAALLAEYSKLPLDQLKMHAEVAMQALQSAMGAGAGGAPPMGAPDAGGAPPMGAPDAGGAPPMGKKEMGAGQMNGGDMKAAQKSQKEISDLRKSLAEQEEMTSKLTQAFTAFVSKPMRKAEVAVPAKSAEPKLNKAEVKAKLTGKIQDRSLTKSDRELINRVLLDQPVADVAIAHLLK